MLVVLIFIIIMKAKKWTTNCSVIILQRCYPDHAGWLSNPSSKHKTRSVVFIYIIAVAIASGTAANEKDRMAKLAELAAS